MRQLRQRCVTTAIALLLCLPLAGCRARQSDEIEMQVRNVGFDEATASPVVILQAGAGGRLLPIWIGPAEAQSIAIEMQKLTPPRPLTHDLVKRILDGTGVVLRRVRITALQERTFFATLVLESGGRDVEIDSRPSDAIALALRAHCPILVSRALVESGAAMALSASASPSVVKLWGATVQDLAPEVAESLGLVGATGVLVSDVDADGAATALRRGDVIVRVDDVAVGDVAALRAVAESDTSVRKVEVRRGDARVTLRLETSSQSAPRG
jgi:bifunctional DNase/RNase